MRNSEDIEQFFNTVIQLHKLMAQSTQESYEEQTATKLQFSALSFIHENDNAMASDLAGSLKLSKSSATQLIDRLVAATFVEKRADKDDKRIIRLSITEKGKEEMLVIKKSILEKMKMLLAGIPDEDIRELIRIHKNMIETLKK
jgi:DNA-binding MarR family transcriptional regulator